MKKMLALTVTLLAVTACSQTELAAMAKQECETIGYKPGTKEYVECTERGYRNTAAQQDAAAGALLGLAILEAMY